MSHSIPDKSAGSTPRGTKAPWKQFGSHSLFIDVDTSAAGFATTPHYVTALNGYHSHWRTVGAHSLYTPSSTGFRVYLLYELSTITVKEAQQWDWSINWIGSFGEIERAKRLSAKHKLWCLQRLYFLFVIRSPLFTKTIAPCTCVLTCYP